MQFQTSDFYPVAGCLLMLSRLAVGTAKAEEHFDTAGESSRTVDGMCGCFSRNSSEVRVSLRRTAATGTDVADAARGMP